jgi:hypothetical protein
MRSAYKILLGEPQGKRPLTRQGVDERIILDWIFGKYGLGVWIGFIWFRIGTGCDVLRT